MTICKFFLRGQCKYGDSCKDEHPVGAVPLSNQRRGSTDEVSTVEHTHDVIKYDLTQGYPQWPLTCYGLNSSWARGSNILTGEFSFEELRVEAYANLRAGTPQNYVAAFNAALTQRQAQISAVLANPGEAWKRASVPCNQFYIGPPISATPAPAVTVTPTGQQPQVAPSRRFTNAGVPNAPVPVPRHNTQGQQQQGGYAHPPQKQYNVPPQHQAPRGTAGQRTKKGNITYIPGSIQATGQPQYQATNRFAQFQQQAQQQAQHQPQHQNHYDQRHHGGQQQHYQHHQQQQYQQQHQQQHGGQPQPQMSFIPPVPTQTTTILPPEAFSTFGNLPETAPQ